VGEGASLTARQSEEQEKKGDEDDEDDQGEGEGETGAAADYYRSWMRLSELELSYDSECGQ
jgi:hypothetical protein